MRRFLALTVLAVLMASCAPPAPDQPPRSLPAASQVATQPARTSTPTLAAATPSPAPTAPPTAAPCDLAISYCIYEGHFLLKRPIAPPGNSSVDQTYRYGTTQEGKREPHHGVEFVNAQGTPVLAAAGGVVVVAQNDKLLLLGPRTGFYGNVVVIEHHLPGIEQTLYTLYGHLYKIDVAVGQEIETGQKIGEVGATGIAAGSHLHFELRMDSNDYKSNRNPELWLTTQTGTGVLAGWVIDARGDPVVKAMVNIQRMEKGVILPKTILPALMYTPELQPVNSDDDFKENFVVGELASGEYRLTTIYNGTVFEQRVEIEPGKLTLVVFSVY